MKIIDEIKLSKELISFPSVTPVDAGAINFLSRKLKLLGVKCKILEFKDKMTVKISAHGGGIHPHFHALKIFGKKSTFIHDYTNTLWIDTSDSNQKYRNESASYPEKKLRGQSLISFVNSLSNKEQKVLVSKDDIFNVMSISLAAEEAVNSGDTIAIKYL